MYVVVLLAKKEKCARSHYTPQWQEYGTSEDDNAAEVAEYSANISLEANLEKELNTVNEALARMEEGTYGTCASCASEINPQRLQVRPESVYCISCLERMI